METKPLEKETKRELFKKNLAELSPRKRIPAFIALEEYKEEILEARSQRFTYGQIVTALLNSDIKTNPTTLAAFVFQYLKTHSKRGRPKGSKQSSKNKSSSSKESTIEERVSHIKSTLGTVTDTKAYLATIFQSTNPSARSPSREEL